MTSEHRRRRRVLGWGAAGLGALYGVGSLVMVPWVHDDLGDRVGAAAVKAGFEGVHASFSGQDGTLRCDAPISSADELERVAEGVWGVRVARVDDECVLQAPTPTANPSTSAPTTTSPATTIETPASSAAPTTNAATTTTATTTTVAIVSGVAASAEVAAGSSQVVLRGTVETDAQRQQLVAAATAAFGAANVVDELTVGDPPTATTGGDAAVAGLAQLVGVLTPGLAEGTASADAGELSLTGVYVDDAARDTVAAAAAAAGVDSTAVTLSPRAEASTDQAAELEAALNEAVGASPIPFDPNQSTLRPEADAILDQVAALARTYAGVTISVDGHTDADGTEAGNLTLSQARADTVRAALVERGVPADQLVATGFGQSQPVAPNDTPANKALNRRVVFSVVTS